MNNEVMSYDCYRTRDRYSSWQRRVREHKLDKQLQVWISMAGGTPNHLIARISNVTDGKAGIRRISK